MSTAIQISEATSLALHSMVYVAASEGGLVTVKEISDAAGFSHAHLSKVLQRLVKAGLLQSLRGPKGGFVLARPAGEISLLHVYEAIEGPLETRLCIAGSKPGTCPFDRCILGELPQRLTGEFRAFLDSRKLSDYVGARRASKAI